MNTTLRSYEDWLPSALVVILLLVIGAVGNAWMLLIASVVSLPLMLIFDKQAQHWPVKVVIIAGATAIICAALALVLTR